ncbi:hypothetical protein GCM10022221_22180 [Actinocorallia aurea]
MWRFRDLEPLLHRADEAMSLGVDDADRRALNAFNPSRMFGTTHTLVAGYQLGSPGETARAHRQDDLWRPRADRLRRRRDDAASR